MERFRAEKEVEERREEQVADMLASRTTCRRRGDLAEATGARMYSDALKVKQVQAHRKKREANVAALKSQTSMQTRHPLKSVAAEANSVPETCKRLYNDASARRIKLNVERERKEQNEDAMLKANLWQRPEVLNFDYKGFWEERLAKENKQEDEDAEGEAEQSLAASPSVDAKTFKFRLYEDFKVKNQKLEGLRKMRQEQELSELQHARLAELPVNWQLKQLQMQDSLRDWWQRRLGEAVLTTMALTNLDYEALIVDEALVAAFKESIANAVLAEVDENSLTAEHVQVKLSPVESEDGEVVVGIEIRVALPPPPPQPAAGEEQEVQVTPSAEAVQALLSSGAVPDSIAAAVVAVEGMDAAIIDSTDMVAAVDVGAPTIEDRYKDRLYYDYEMRKQKLEEKKEALQAVGGCWDIYFENKNKEDTGEKPDEEENRDARIQSSIERLHRTPVEFIRYQVLAAANAYMQSPAGRPGTEEEDQLERRWSKFFTTLADDETDDLNLEEFTNLCREDLSIFDNELTDVQIAKVWELVSNGKERLTREEVIEFLRLPPKAFKEFLNEFQREKQDKKDRERNRKEPLPPPIIKALDDPELARSIERLHCGTRVGYVRHKMLEAARAFMLSPAGRNHELSVEEDDPSTRRWSRFFRIVDADDSGSLSYKQFKFMCREDLVLTKEEVADKELVQIYNVISRGDEAVSREDLIQFLGITPKEFTAQLHHQQWQQRCIDEKFASSFEGPWLRDGEKALVFERPSGMMYWKKTFADDEELQQHTKRNKELLTDWLYQDSIVRQRRQAEAMQAAGLQPPSLEKKLPPLEYNDLLHSRPWSPAGRRIQRFPVDTELEHVEEAQIDDAETEAETVAA